MVEAVLAIGVVSFSFLGIFALLPVGIQLFHQAEDTSVSAEIAQRIASDAEQEDFNILIGNAVSGNYYALPMRYFDDQGSEVNVVNPMTPSRSELAKILYWVRVRVRSRGIPIPRSIPRPILHRCPPLAMSATIREPVRILQFRLRAIRQESISREWSIPSILSMMPKPARQIFGSKPTPSWSRETDIRTPRTSRMDSRHFTASSSAFSLVEVLVTVAVIVALLIIMVSMTDQAASTWRRTTGKIEEFREARDAFETLTTRISQATLNTYWDYNSTTLPTAYERRSELRFISGPVSGYLGDGPNGTRVTHCVFFHALFGSVDGTQGAIGANSAYHGLEGLLNVWGYFVELNSDDAFRPGFLNTAPNALPPKYRFRLMEFRQSSEQLATYNHTSGLDPNSSVKAAAIGYQGTDWYKAAANGSSAPCRVVAENIVSLIIVPRLSKADEQALPAGLGSSNPDYSPLAPNYAYDSSLTMNPGQPGPSALTNPKCQLPPVLQVTLVAIDEVSAARLNLTATSTDLFNVSNKFSSTARLHRGSGR